MRGSGSHGVEAHEVRMGGGVGGGRAFNLSGAGDMQHMYSNPPPLVSTPNFSASAPNALHLNPRSQGWVYDMGGGGGGEMSRSAGGGSSSMHPASSCNAYGEGGMGGRWQAWE
jgi:hypothetical protein